MKTMLYEGGVFPNIPDDHTRGVVKDKKIIATLSKTDDLKQVLKEKGITDYHKIVSFHNSILTMSKDRVIHDYKIKGVHCDRA